MKREDRNSEENFLKKSVNEVIAYVTSVEQVAKLNGVEQGRVPKELYLEEIRRYIKNKYKKDVQEAVFNGVESFLWGYYIIDELIEDVDISDVKIISYNQIYFKKNGKRYRSDICFYDKKDFERFIERISIRNLVNKSNQNAMREFSDTSHPNWRMRFTLSTPYITNSKGYYLHIRKHPAQKKTIEKLIGEGMLDKRQADYLINKFESGESILFCGKGGSGKTTLLNALMEYVGDKSIYCIQKSDELFMEKDAEFMSYHLVENKGEGKISYSLADIAPYGLTSDIECLYCLYRIGRSRRSRDASFDRGAGGILPLQYDHSNPQH